MKITHVELLTVLTVNCSSLSTVYKMKETVHIEIQDAQLSQRDRSAGYIWPKVEDWNSKTIFY